MVMHSLSVIVRFHRVFCERQLEREGIALGYPEQSVLLMLSVYDRINQEGIAQHFLIDKGSITKTLAKLEAKALILRWENPENKREKLLALTDAGRGTIERINQILADWDQAVFAGLNAEELVQVEKLTETMTRNAIHILRKESLPE
jgi:DNA-binding MarR family transcriptional regulator